MNIFKKMHRWFFGISKCPECGAELVEMKHPHYEYLILGKRCYECGWKSGDTCEEVVG